ERLKRLSAFRIAQGGHDALWLMEHVIGGLFRDDSPPIDFDLIAVGVDLDAHLADDAPIDPDTPVGDQPFGSAAGSDPRLGEHLLQSFDSHDDAAVVRSTEDGRKQHRLHSGAGAEPTPASPLAGFARSVSGSGS